jgi:hypothetical protein
MLAITSFLLSFVSQGSLVALWFDAKKKYGIV